MQPIQKISKILSEIANPEHYLFALSDLQSIIPNYHRQNLKEVIRRIEKRGLLKRVCRGIYLYEQVDYPQGLILYHTAAKLRAGELNYLSLESVLSDLGVISQVPMNWITLMSSGRSYIVDCGEFGHIEFIHTKRPQKQKNSELTYDSVHHLWRASAKLALRDMKLTHRKTDLINKEALHELI